MFWKLPERYPNDGTATRHAPQRATTSRTAYIATATEGPRPKTDLVSVATSTSDRDNTRDTPAGQLETRVVGAVFLTAELSATEQIPLA